MKKHFWKQAQSLKFPKLFKLIHKHTRTHGASKEFTIFDAQHKGLALRMYKIIRKQKKELTSGKTFVDKKTGATITKTSTGKFKGNNNSGTYKVTISGKTFFIKNAIKKFILGNHTASSKLKLALKDKEINGMKIKLITPHLIYVNNHTSNGILVSDFFDSKDVILISDLTTPPKSRLAAKKLSKFKLTEIDNNLTRLAVDLFQKGIIDIGAHNAFYHIKNNSILLFDSNLK
jgi:hypothetical protein